MTARVFAIIVAAQALTACQSADTVLVMQSKADELETVANSLEDQAQALESAGDLEAAQVARDQAAIVREGSDVMRDGVGEIREQEKEQATLERSAGFADGLFSLMRWIFAIVAAVAVVLALARIGTSGPGKAIISRFFGGS